MSLSLNRIAEFSNYNEKSVSLLVLHNIIITLLTKRRSYITCIIGIFVGQVENCNRKGRFACL